MYGTDKTASLHGTSIVEGEAGKVLLPALLRSRKLRPPLVSDFPIANQQLKLKALTLLSRGVSPKSCVALKLAFTFKC